MDLTEVDECFEKGLLKEGARSKKFALQDIAQAEFFLNESFDLISIQKKEMAAIAMYNAAFHAARALLYLGGIKERSHYCMQKYLEANFCKKGMLSQEELSLFDLLRGIRQEVQYNVTKIKFEENLDELYDKTEKFIETVQKIVKSRGAQNHGEKTVKPNGEAPRGVVK
ncbi:MAG: HEPN domain-containing protein [Candidatus Diapherotrites archaeon]|nr:HEPN domain-containing protein [Candidatus Micrarchaeota archaeon]